MVAGLPAGMHPLQAHLGPQGISVVDGGYPPHHHLLVDGAGRDPLELGVLEGLEGTPAGMIKYESPLLE